MRRMNPETKRVVTAVVAIFLALVMIVGMALPFFVQGAEPQGITIEGTVGFGTSGLYKLGQAAPAELVISNSGADFDGEVQIQVALSADSSSPALAVHAYALTLPRGGSKKITMDISIPAITRSIQVTVVNTKGKSVASQQFGTTALAEASPLVGAFSDTFDSLNYLRLLAFGIDTEQKLGNQFIRLDQNTMPSSLDMLQSFNVIVINDFDTKSLSAAQTTLLRTWVQNGGILLLGTGRQFDKTLGGLQSLGLDIAKTGEAAHATLTDHITQARTTFRAGVTYLAAALRMNGTAEAYGDNHTPVLTSTPFGSGTVIVSGFDLGASPIPEEYDVTQLLNRILSANLIIKNLAFSASSFYGYYSPYDNIMNTIDTLPNMNSGMLSVIFLIIGAYLVFLGPVLYLILKKRDKRDAGWYIIPGVAIFCTLAIYFLSFNTMYKKPFVNQISTLRLQSGNTAARAAFHFSAYAPRKGHVAINFSEPLSPRIPLANQYNYSSRTISNGLKTNDGTILYKMNYGDTPGVTFYNQMPWAQNYASADQVITLPGALEANITISAIATGELRLVGSVTNHTGLTLEDVVITQRYVGYYNLGTLAPGETRALGEVYDAAGAAASIADLAYSLYPYVYAPGIDDVEDARITELKRSLMQSQETRISAIPAAQSGTGAVYVQSAAAGMEADVMLVAFSRDDVYGGDVTVNGRKPVDFMLNLVLMDIAPSFPVGERIELPYGVIRPSEVQSDVYFDLYNDGEIYMSESGALSFTYAVPPQLSVELFQVDQINFFSSVHEAQIYNNVSDAWEGLGTSEYKSAAPYLDAQNRIHVRCTIISANQFFLPPIRLVGKMAGN